MDTTPLTLYNITTFTIQSQFSLIKVSLLEITTSLIDIEFGVHDVVLESSSSGMLISNV